MAIQFSEDMLDRMGESQRKQTLEMLKQMDEENKQQEKPVFRVQLYEEYSINKFMFLKETTFETKEDAINFSHYVLYKQPCKFGKIITIDNNGELVYELYF